MRDLADECRFDAVNRFAISNKSVRDHVAQAGKLHYKYQKDAWLLDAVELYCAAVAGVADLVHPRGATLPPRTPQARSAVTMPVTVLSQTFRSLIHSRMRVGMERYAREYPDADVVLFEPARDDEVIFFANMFSYADRRRLAEHAYRHTLSELRRRADELNPVFASCGIA